MASTETLLGLLSSAALFATPLFAQTAAAAEKVSASPDILQDPSLALRQIGTLQAVPSSRIERSGVSIGFECLDRFIFDPERCYDKLSETGVKWARCQTGWCRCETEKGKYDFQWLDDVVDNLRRRGIQPWFNVGFGNKLYMPNAYGEAAVGSVPLYFGEETLQAWKNYIRALSRHFRGRVTYYEIWNEPEIGAFWQPSKPDPLEYLRLVKLTGTIIREEDPRAKIGGCSSGVLLPYTSQLIRAGIGREIDFYCVHPYRIQPEKDYLNEIAALRRLFDANGGAQVRLWQGESGFASHFPTGHWLHPYVLDSETNQAKWLLRRYVTDARVGMDVSSFFQMVDMTARPYQKANETLSDPACHGILRGSDYERKESYYAISHYAAVFDGDTVPADLYASLNFDRIAPRDRHVSRLTDAAAITATFLRKGWPFYLYYLPEDVQYGYAGIAGVDLAVLDDAEKSIRDPVLVDLLKGRVFAVQADRDKSGNCTRFRQLPLTDYPLLITDREALQGRITFTPAANAD